jgi:hypothetical protein
MAPRWEEEDVALEPASLEPSAEVGEDDITLLRRVVDRHQAELEDCYAAAANSAGPDRPLEGRIDIRFTLMSGGRAVNVSPVVNTTGSAALAGCVSARVESWRFPDSPAWPLDLEWPFLFRAPDDAARP